MFTRSLNFDRSVHSFKHPSHFIILLLTIMLFASLLAALGTLPKATAQRHYGQTMSFGQSDYSQQLQFVDPNGKNSIPFWAAGLSSDPNQEGIDVNFALYPMSDPDFLSRYQDYAPPDYHGDNVQFLNTTGLTPSANWAAFVPTDHDHRSYYNESTSTPITVPPNTPAGIYIIQATAPGREMADSIIVISPSVMVMKRGENGQVTIWATSLQSGTPVADMMVTLYTIEDRQTLSQGKTDVKGIVELNAGNLEDVIAIGRTENDTTLAGLGYEWRASGGGYWDSYRQTEGHQFYLYTDRPLYRPGHTVYFDAILRRTGVDGLTPIAASTPVTATLRDGRNNLVDTVVVAADEYGKANGSFTLGDEISLGSYYVNIEADGQRKQQRFMVEEFVKPEYSVEISTPKSYAIEGDSVPVTIDSAYFFGQPVTDAKVKLKVYRQRIYYYYWWSNDDSYGGYNDGLQDTREGVTDEQGQWTTTLEPTTGGSKYGTTYTLVAEVTDDQEKVIQAQYKFKVYFEEFDLKIRTERYGYTIGQPITVTLQTRTHDGTPHINQNVDVSVMSYRDGDERAVQTLNATTDAQGNAIMTFEGVPHGWYYLTATATDSRGRTSTRTRYLCIYDPNAQSWWWGNSSDVISVQPDKDSYVPGETAHLLIQSRIESGTGLLTLEREGIYDEILVKIDGPVTMVDVPITDEYGPNIFATFHLFQWASDQHETLRNIGDREGNLITVETELAVDLVGKKLNLGISADAEKYLPGQEAELTFTLTDKDGLPTAGVISVALVDEALFSLQADLSENLFTTFYNDGSNRVGTYQSLVREPDWYWNERYFVEPTPTATYSYEDEPYVPTGGQLTPVPQPAPTATAPSTEAGIADESDSSEPETPGSQPRRNFQDTAYWNAAIVVGADGKATITVPLPDNLTTWRITARAVTQDTRIGTATGSLLVTKEIISRPTLPRFAVVGDQFSLRAVAQNYTGMDLQGEAGVESTHLVIVNPDSQTLDLPNNKSAVGRWTAIASQMGTGLVTSTLQTAQGQDIVELPLLTKSFSAPERWVAAGQAAPQATEKFTMPLNAIHDASELTIFLSPSIALGLLDGLDDLIAYPYGCVEQTMSRVLPSAVAIQVYNELGLPNPKADEIPAIVKKGLQKLYGYQQYDGGWGWFYDDDSALYLTSYVLLGLTTVQQAGFEVDSSVLSNGFYALDRLLDRNVVASSLSADQRQEAENDDMRAFALYVKAQADRGDLEAAQRLAQVADTLRSDSLSMLALALHLDGDTTGAQALADTLLARVNEDTDDAYWDAGESRYDWYYWRTMASRDKYTALAVRTLATLRPESEQLPKAVRWLMKNRRGASWRNTQATAFAVLGLLDYIQVSGELESNYSYTISVNNVQVGNGRVTPENVTQPIEPLVIPGNVLRVGENELTIARSEQGGVIAASIDAENPLYYTAQMRQELFYDSFAEIASAQKGLSLSRSYRLVEGAPRDDGAYNIGDVVEVSLGLTIDDEIWYLLIEDPIPAGFEALNERLNATSYTLGYSSGYWWRNWGYNRKDVRDDRVDFFITHGYSGQRTLTYLMRATVPGTFSVLPGQAYPMYDDDVWARSASRQVKVVPEVLDARPAFLGDFDHDCRITEFDALQATKYWGTDHIHSDLIADGVVHLNDMAAAIQRQGTDCVVSASSTAPIGLNQPTEDARFLLFFPLEETTVGSEIKAYIMVEDVKDLGGFEFTLNYNREVLRVKNVSLDSSVGGDVMQLGPTINNAQGKVTFGAFDMRAAYESRDRQSHIQQVMASARESTNMANLQILSTVIFQAVATGDMQIQIDDTQAIDSDGLMLAAALDANHTPDIRVNVGHLYLPLVMQ